MTQVKDLLAHARAQGVAFFQGKVATGNTMESARVMAILPAVKAIEAGEITLESNTSLAGDITRAYAKGAGNGVSIYRGAKSFSTAVSKTLSFLVAAQHGVATSTLEAVGAVIRNTNDTDTQKVMRNGAFEKLTALCRKAADAKAVPDDATIRGVLNPVEKPADTDKVLAGLFKKLSSLAEKVYDLNNEQYADMLVAFKRYDRLATEHEARAKRNEEHAGKTVTVVTAPVAPATQETSGGQHEEQDDEFSALLAA